MSVRAKSTRSKREEVTRIAQLLFHTPTDWVTFYREILGAKGIVRQMFPTPEALAEFEKSKAHDEIQRMLAELRKKGPVPNRDDALTRAITVRIPKSLHAALRAEAFEHRTSMNKLCISKLLQLIDGEMVPAETSDLDEEE